MFYALCRCNCDTEIRFCCVIVLLVHCELNVIFAFSDIVNKHIAHMHTDSNKNFRSFYGFDLCELELYSLRPLEKGCVSAFSTQPFYNGNPTDFIGKFLK